ncbi:MAG TPA: hypothetical protein VNO30_44630 [Kofleriaceae bacterium]|nr:hypothetical protein [Kofleriaceae bacterium]
MRLLPILGLGLLAACDQVPSAADEAETDDAVVLALGSVTNVVNLATCPNGAPSGATCKRVTVGGCPGIETETLDATVAFWPAPAQLKGTVVHFSGSGGTGYQVGGAQQYQTAGLRNVWVAWASDWEQTASLGIRTAGCRPSTVLKWIFDAPALHAGSRAIGFCGEGFSGGSGQLGYALAHYGMGNYLDYVNELSGPPFARIDLGCDGDAPATAVVCGATDTMRLPGSLNAWENIQSPLSCGSTGVPAAELNRWKTDSIAYGGVYDYPKTEVQFYACTYQATAVTAQGKIYYDLIAAAAGGNPSRASYHCYSQADNCQGENLGTGSSAATQAMINRCVPHHM